MTESKQMPEIAVAEIGGVHWLKFKQLMGQICIETCLLLLWGRLHYENGIVDLAIRQPNDPLWTGNYRIMNQTDPQ
jgi:hypothetical protein